MIPAKNITLVQSAWTNLGVAPMRIHLLDVGAIVVVVVSATLPVPGASGLTLQAGALDTMIYDQAANVWACVDSTSVPPIATVAVKTEAEGPMPAAAVPWNSGAIGPTGAASTEAGPTGPTGATGATGPSMTLTSLDALLATLPTENPGAGKAWNNLGVVTMGTS